MKSSKFFLPVLLMLAIIFIAPQAWAGKGKGDDRSGDTIKSNLVSGLKFRNIGPAFASGRISDFVVNPSNPSEYYVAVSSGHIWKTVNNGTTFQPVFENYDAYSIGCLAMDPGNHHVIWAGTGENNHQRALGYGNGVYKSVDGGKSWKNMGLKESRQIGMIAIHPENTDIVFVAAEGSAWGPGGDRGLYRTEDGGETWDKVLDISEHTGVNNVLIDPRDPRIMYATSEQRRRHVHTKIGGGPESGIWKSTDGGNSWRELKKGLPGGDMGGIGIAISPVKPDIVYAIIEAEGTSGGFFRSTDRGETWKKMSDHHSSGQYYNEIYCHPHDEDIVYSMETVSKITVDGGKTWRSLGISRRHVDDHALWIDPDDHDHFIIGGDGGIYETFDHGETYLHKTNLPVTQYYRVNVDNQEPFYWVYGGTQDNNSMGGPSRNTSTDGVSSCEWVVTLGGDGFWQAIDPQNPDIVYSEYQYGNIFRYDRKSGERLKIKPQPRAGEENYKWNWNTPFILSPHSNTRLYIAANKVFRSDDRGNSWQVISDDITAQVDRNTWPVMGRYWSIDAVVKDVSTSLFGTAVSLAESPVKEDLLYVGTDDGVIQVTEDAGQTWRKIDKFPGVPEYTYVSDILPSRFDENVVYAAFDNRKRDDFKPYILKSADKGRTWESIANNLPSDETVHTVEQDFINSDLLFAGTELGLYFSADEGKIWTALESGLPSIAIRDMTIQERESDLVLASFGRGFFILDDYSPLRQIEPALIEKEAHIFPVKDALMYMQTGGRYGTGSTYYTADNPPFGAIFTYYMKEVPKTLKAMRQEREKELAEKKERIPMPTMDELRAEENEVAPHLIFTIRDGQGREVRKLFERPKKGIHRVNWNLRYTGSRPVNLRNQEYDPFADPGSGYLAMPGDYTVELSLFVRGEVRQLAGPVPFTARILDNTTLPAEDRAELVAFQDKVTELARAMYGAQRFADEMIKKARHLRQAAQATPDASPVLMQKILDVQQELDDIKWKFEGQEAKASSEENWPAVPPLSERLMALMYPHWSSTSPVTQTQRDQFSILSEEFPPVLERIREVDEALQTIDREMEDLGAPWTPGRIPDWR